MSSARRPAKCSSACLRCAGHTRPPVQRAMTSSGRRAMAEPHSGQTTGMTNSRAPRGRFSGSARTIWGITSPARRTTTVSPMRRSRRRISSSLCSVTLVTVVPPTNTGSRRATGVIAPVRPTCTSIAMQPRGHFFRREFVRDRPARLARPEPQRTLQLEAVDLVDDAVDLERQIAAPVADFRVERGQFRGPVRDAAVAVDRQAERGQRVEQRALRGRQRPAFGLADAVGEERQRPLRGDRQDRAGARRRPPCCADSRTAWRPPLPAVH